MEPRRRQSLQLRHILGSDDESSGEFDDGDSTTAATSLSASWHSRASFVPPPVPKAPVSSMPPDVIRTPGKPRRSIFMPTRTSVTNALLSPLRVKPRLSLSRPGTNQGSPTGNNRGGERRSSTRSSLTSPQRVSSRKSMLEKAGEGVRKMSLSSPRPRADDDRNAPDDEYTLPTVGLTREEVLAALVFKELEMIDS